MRAKLLSISILGLLSLIVFAGLTWLSFNSVQSSAAAASRSAARSTASSHLQYRMAVVRARQLDYVLDFKVNGSKALGDEAVNASASSRATKKSNKSSSTTRPKASATSKPNG